MSRPAARSTIAASILTLFCGPALGATYAPWLRQIGISDSILSAANWGKDQLLGVVDTGIIPEHQVFALGQVSQASSSCAAVTFDCSAAYRDDNGHGTAVASIAAANDLLPFAAFARASGSGGYSIAANSVIGVAPDANVLAKKVLAADGMAYSVDIANGVRQAADAGASVINVSISYGNSAEIVSAINYAAAKGAFIVWAGGNESASLLGGAGTYGLTQAAISRLLFAGSVDPANRRSAFSNTPGTGVLVDTAGAKKSYATRWVVAPGEAIVAPGIKQGADAWVVWNGTSMSTPIVSGSLLLLESAWPILKTLGTAANLLLATTTDLGARGADAIYGAGMVNLATAFRPYGTLTVTLANGRAVPVTTITSPLLSSGALGTLSAIQSVLANYTAFDSYSRNFSVNLSGLVKSRLARPTLNPLPTHIDSGPTRIALAGGRELAYWASAADAGIGSPQRRYAMVSDREGQVLALGYGLPVRSAYAAALYGDTDFPLLPSEAAAGNLAALAEGGGLFSFGTPLSPATRIAMSWSDTGARTSWAATPGAPQASLPAASNLQLGMSHRFSDSWTAGATLGVLHETQGLLGSVYQSGSALGFGTRNRSYGIDFSTTLSLGKAKLMLGLGFSSTGADNGTGLLAGTTNIVSNSFDATLLAKDVRKEGDEVMVSVKQPLRVQSGQVAVVLPSVAPNGMPQFARKQLSLVPQGREIDYQLDYRMPTGKRQWLGFHLLRRSDVAHSAGNNDFAAGVNWTMRF